MDLGYSDPDEEGRLRENRKCNSKVLFFIQQAVHESIFSRIVAATTSRQAWMILQTKFQGSLRVVVVKLQILQLEFEVLQMKSNEAVQDFISKVMTIVNQIKTYGDFIKNHTVVAKVLRSLTPKFYHVVAAIEE